MALLKRLRRSSRKTKKLEKETAKKRRYLEHYKKAGPHHAFTFAQWLEKGEQPVYFKGIRQPTAEAKLRESRVTLKRSRRGK